MKFDKEMVKVYVELQQQWPLYLLDVREPEEYAQGHLPQARLLPLKELPQHIQELSQDIPVYVYCRSGRRAAVAKRKLQAAGFTNVYNIGGTIHWTYPLKR